MGSDSVLMTRASRAGSSHSKPRQHSVGLLYSFCFVIAATMIPIFPLVPLYTGDGSKYGGSALLAALSGFIAGCLCLISARAGQMFRSVFWLFSYVFLFVPFVAQLSSARFPLPFSSYDQGSAYHAVLISIAGCLAFELGYGSRRRISSSSVRDSLSGVRIDKGRAAGLFRIGIISAGTGLLYARVWPFFTSRTAVSEVFLGAQLNAARDFEVSSPLGSLMLLATRVPIFIGLCAVLACRPFGTVPLRRSTLAVGIIAFGAVNNPISTPRLWLAMVIVGVMSASGKLGSRKRIFALVVSILIVSATVLPLIDVFRGHYTGGTDLADVLALESMTSDLDYSQSQQVLNAVAYVDANGHTLGSQTAGAAGVFIPRRFWVSKPIDTGRLIQPRGVDVNPSSSLWIEGYVEFGWLGLFIYLCLAGRLAAAFDVSWLRSALSTDGSRGDGVILGVLVGGFLFVLRGSLQPALALILPIAATVLFVTQRSAKAFPGKYQGVGRV